MTTEFNERDVEDIKALFSSPLQVPAVFKRWLVDQFAINVPSIPISQIVGGRAVERVIYSSTKQAQYAGSGGEQTVASFPLRGNQIAKNGRLVIDLSGSAASPDASIKMTVSLKLGGTTVVYLVSDQDSLPSSPGGGHAVFTVWNMNSYAQQACSCYGAGSWYGFGYGFSTVDLSADTTLTITVKWDSGDGNDVYTLDTVVATIYNPSEGDQ